MKTSDDCISYADINVFLSIATGHTCVISLISLATRAWLWVCWIINTRPPTNWGRKGVTVTIQRTKPVLITMSSVRSAVYKEPDTISCQTLQAAVTSFALSFVCRQQEAGIFGKPTQLTCLICKSNYSRSSISQRTASIKYSLSPHLPYVQWWHLYSQSAPLFF